MNLLRSLFLGLSRIPPALMLGIIAGVAIVVSIIITGTISSIRNADIAQIEVLRAHNSAKNKIIYAAKDLPEGAIITSDALEERDVEQSKTPPDAITSSSLCLGRVTKYGIASGQIISQHDLAPQCISVGFQSKLKKGMLYS